MADERRVPFNKNETEIAIFPNTRAHTENVQDRGDD